MSAFVVGYDTLNDEAAVPNQEPAGAFLKEKPDSPEIELGEQGLFTHTFDADWTTARSLVLPRGTFVRDSNGNIFRLLTTKLQHKAGNVGEISHATESISFAVPPDEFDIDDVENNPSLKKHPRYAALTDQDFSNIQSALDLPQQQSRAEAETLNTYAPSSLSFARWNELLSKLRRGEDSFYAAGIKITWGTFSFSPQPMNLGGYIEDPTLILPFTFYIGTAGNIFPNGISWLRFADKQPFQRTWYKLTRTWVGFPNAHWDPDIYAPI